MEHLKLKLIGVTAYAEKYMTVEDLEAIKGMIGCFVETSENKAIDEEGVLFILPDGEEIHGDFLILETVLYDK